MPPPVEAFPASQLPLHLQSLPSGRRRKPDVDLERCALARLTQYECDVRRTDSTARGTIVCAPIVRTFRRCADGLTVETTALEGERATKAQTTETTER